MAADQDSEDEDYPITSSGGGAPGEPPKADDKGGGVSHADSEQTTAPARQKSSNSSKPLSQDDFNVRKQQAIQYAKNLGLTVLFEIACLDDKPHGINCLNRWDEQPGGNNVVKAANKLADQVASMPDGKDRINTINGKLLPRIICIKAFCQDHTIPASMRTHGETKGASKKLKGVDLSFYHDICDEADRLPGSPGTYFARFMLKTTVSACEAARKRKTTDKDIEPAKRPANKPAKRPARMTQSGEEEENSVRNLLVKLTQTSNMAPNPSIQQPGLSLQDFMDRMDKKDAIIQKRDAIIESRDNTIDRLHKDVDTLLTRMTEDAADSSLLWADLREHKLVLPDSIVQAVDLSMKVRDLEEALEKKKKQLEGRNKQTTAFNVELTNLRNEHAAKEKDLRDKLAHTEVLGGAFCDMQREIGRARKMLKEKDNMVQTMNIQTRNQREKISQKDEEILNLKKLCVQHKVEGWEEMKKDVEEAQLAKFRRY